MKLKLMLFAVLGMAAANVAFAQGNTTCPVDQQIAMDNEFHYGTSAVTTCNKHRDHIRVALSMSSADLNPKSGYHQVLANALNMAANYEQFYGLTVGNEGYRIAVVAHFKGGKYLLNDAKYAALNGGAPNPSRVAVEKLLAKGIQVIMCQNTMRANGWKTEDLIPGVTQVPGGVVALADLGMSGWVVMTP